MRGFKRKKPLTALGMAERVVGDGDDRKPTGPIEYKPTGLNPQKHDVWVSQAEYDRCAAKGIDVTDWTVVR